MSLGRFKNQDAGLKCCWIWICFVVGGESSADNCQILQTRVNRFKSDKEQMDKTQLKGYSCEIEFTGIFWNSSPC